MKRRLAVIILLPLAAQAAENVQPPDIPPADVWVKTGGGQIRVLDKQKAQSRLLTLKTGEKANFETLTLTMLACVVRAPGLPENAAGFLEVSDSRNGEPGFRGWMIEREPGLATLQSPVYGVRVVACDKPTPEAIAEALPPKPPPASEPPPDVTTPAPPDPAKPDADLAPPPGQDLGKPP